MATKASIESRFIINGRLRLRSPLLIGMENKGYSGTDKKVQKDEYGHPYIPASSLCGALRHYFFNRLRLPSEDRQGLEYFWGSDKAGRISDSEIIQQSAFIVQDLEAMAETETTVRDGIKINSRTGAAEDMKKYEFEVVEPGPTFEFKAEVIVRDGFPADIFAKTINTIVKALANGEIALGAMTAKGFGRCKLEEYRVYKYNFGDKDTTKKDRIDTIVAWLNRDRAGTASSTTASDNYAIELDFDNVYPGIHNRFALKAEFYIKNSLIVKAYSGLPEDPDAMHIRSSGRDIIPGTSIKGAIRARAIKILNTLGADGGEMVKDLFGWAPDTADESQNIVRGKSSGKRKSRLIVEEACITGSPKEKEIQCRTRINRFTGGVIGGGLFDSAPIWGGEDRVLVNINLKIEDFERWEAGLMLLVLKDLWDGDLPLGGEKNIGRGVLIGRKAHISIKEKSYILECGGGNLLIEGKGEELENLVQSLLEKCTTGKGA